MTSAAPEEGRKGNSAQPKGPYTARERKSLLIISVGTNTFLSLPPSHVHPRCLAGEKGWQLRLRGIHSVTGEQQPLLSSLRALPQINLQISMWELTPLHGRVRLETAFHLCCPFGKHPLKWMITPKVAYSSVKINRLFWEGINKANFPCKKSLNKFYFKRIYQHWKTQRKRIRESIASQKEKKKKKEGKEKRNSFLLNAFLKLRKSKWSWRRKGKCGICINQH